MLAGEVVGFCAVTLDSKTRIGEIDLNAVAPGHQGKGLGALMYEHAERMMKDAGMVVATVGTGGDQSHEPARHAYEKAGFKAAIPSIYYYKSL